MKTLAYYSILRFMPYVETEEFVNVGVVLCCPKTGFLGFRLAHRRARVANFFESLDKSIYVRALKTARDELIRVRARLAGLPTDAFESVFSDLTEARESLLRFREPRAVLTADPEQELAEKFAYYVEHDFAGKEYQERLLEQAVRGILRSAQLQQAYQPEDVGSEDFHLNLPMVRMRDGKPVAAIKPLFLGDAEPTRVYDKGAHWASKLRLLRDIGGFDGKLMFALQAPAVGEATRRAFDGACEDLHHAGAEIRLISQQDGLLDFARSH